MNSDIKPPDDPTLALFHARLEEKAQAIAADLERAGVVGTNLTTILAAFKFGAIWGGNEFCKMIFGGAVNDAFN